MALSLKKKEKVVCNIKKTAKKALSAVIASLDRVTVNEITQLRKEARRLHVCVHVIKNTLMQRVIENTPLECLRDILIGQNVVVFSLNHPRDSARVCVKFSKDNDNFKIKGAVFEGNFIPALRINVLSDLLDHNEAIAKLIAVIKIGSVGKLIRILHVLSKIK